MIKMIISQHHCDSSQYGSTTILLIIMYGKKAQQLISQLKEQGIVDAEGTIKLSLLGTDVDINDKSAVGNLLQEWLGEWMNLNGFYHRVNPNSQEFPDFYLGESNELDLLEVKTFDYVNNPNFDVAQFDAYTRSLCDKAYRLDADYLILGYSLSHGVVKINDIWLKKIWEMTCPSERFAIKTQVKQDKIHNIRPYNFKSMSNGYQPFNSRLAFITAIRDTLEKYKDSKEEADSWMQQVTTSYTNFMKSSL